MRHLRGMSHAPRPPCPARNGGSRPASPTTTRPSPSWRRAPQAIARRRRRASWSGWSSTRRSTPPAPPPTPRDLVDPDRFPVFETRRGGQYTYHGPGQRVVYVMLDLGARGRDVRAFVQSLEAWVIAALAEFNVTGEIRDGRVGVWVARPDKPPRPDGRPARGQDRRHRHPAAQMGELPRDLDQRRPRSRPFHRHRSLRHRRPRGDLAGRPRPAGDDGRPRRGARAHLRRGFRGLAPR